VHGISAHAGPTLTEPPKNVSASSARRLQTSSPSNRGFEPCESLLPPSDLIEITSSASLLLKTVQRPNSAGHTGFLLGRSPVFITAPGLVQHLHPSHVAPRQSHWPAITLALEHHWYLLIHDVCCQGRKLSQTSLVAWDSTLLDLLERIPAADLRGI